MTNYFNDYTKEDAAFEKGQEEMYRAARSKCPDHCITCKYLSGVCDEDIINTNCNITDNQPDEDILFCPEYMRDTKIVDLSVEDFVKFFKRMNKKV